METMTRQRTRLCLLAGAIAPVLFWLVVIVDGFTKPGYDARKDFISELALGDHGWVQSANFIAVGLLIIALAAGLHQLFPAGRASRFGPPLVAIFGLGLVASGIFRTDPGNYPVKSDTITTTGSIHIIAFFVILASIIPACFVFARRFRIEPNWQGYGRYSFINGFLIPGMLVLFMLAPDQVTGLTQRALVAVIFLWIELIALRALALTPRETQAAVPA
jgi:hypothetical membrane protein